MQIYTHMYVYVCMYVCISIYAYMYIAAEMQLFSPALQVRAPLVLLSKRIYIYIYIYIFFLFFFFFVLMHRVNPSAFLEDDVRSSHSVCVCSESRNCSSISMF